VLFRSEVHFRSPEDARAEGIETVYQNLAMSPALSIADNMFLGREWRKPGFMGTVLRQMDRPRMEAFARTKLNELGLMTIQDISQPVETLSGGQRQGVAVARAAAFGSKVVILDEPTAALGVKESRRVLELIRDVRARGIPIVLISHNMPHVFEVADRIHIHRLGRRLCVIDPKDYTMSDAVAFMTGAKLPEGVTEARRACKTDSGAGRWSGPVSGGAGRAARQRQVLPGGGSCRHLGQRCARGADGWLSLGLSL